MTNNIHDIYVLKAFEKLVYSDMIKLLNELKVLVKAYDKNDDSFDLADFHQPVKKEVIIGELSEEKNYIEEKKLEIKNYLYDIKEQEVFDQLIKKIDEAYNGHEERTTLKKIVSIINERIQSFENINQVTHTTQWNIIEILNEWTEWDEISHESWDINVTDIEIPNRKKDILKQIFQYLKGYNKIEFEQFLEHIQKNGDIDFEIEPWVNLYSFAITNWYDDIVNLIQAYKK